VTRALRIPARAEAQGLILAFAEPTRLRLLALLARGETCVCDLTGALGVPQPTASRHLARLRRGGWVTVRREGLWAYYSLAPARSEVHQRLLDCLAACAAEMRELEADRDRCQRLRDARRCSDPTAVSSQQETPS
jgi:ArsR family transcriptional regulator